MLGYMLSLCSWPLENVKFLYGFIGHQVRIHQNWSQDFRFWLSWTHLKHVKLTSRSSTVLVWELVNSSTWTILPNKSHNHSWPMAVSVLLGAFVARNCSAREIGLYEKQSSFFVQVHLSVNGGVHCVELKINELFRLATTIQKESYEWLQDITT